MKKIFYILTLCLFTASLSYAAGPPRSCDALGWHGYDSLISSDLFSNDDWDDEDDEIFRKRRHRRRRKIRPPHKGW